MYTSLTALSASTVYLGGGLLLGGCNSEKSAQGDQESASIIDCDDLTGVSEGEIEKREKLGYVKESPIAENQCSNCKLYIPSETDPGCGKCMLFAGPVHATGYCTYWAPLDQAV